MEALTNNEIIINHKDIIQESNGNFIEANTQKVTLEHLKNDCVIPVFSKDNETTISHFEFIETLQELARGLYPNKNILRPDIRVSHVIKGRTPSAIGKPVKELLEREKTIYYERMAFMIELPELRQEINGNQLSLTLGGVRAYNQENLYHKKTMEKFKVFIGFKNWVCCNLCLSTDGFSNELKVSSIADLKERAFELFNGYNAEKHLEQMRQLKDQKLSEIQFAHLMGRLKMYSYVDDQTKKSIFPLDINDGQINAVIREYYGDYNFSGYKTEEIDLWKLYNLFTGANKSSYIHNTLERNVKLFDFTSHLSESLVAKTSNWLLN